MKNIFIEIYRQKKRSLNVALLLLVVNIAVYAVNYGYLDSSVNEARQKWHELRRRVSVAERGDVSVVYRQALADLEKLSALIPLKRQFPSVLGDILDAAASSNVVIGTVTYKPQVVKNEDLLAYSINMSVSGSYAAVKSFLADLQKNRELVVIEAVALSNRDPFEENVSMNVNLTVYLREGA